MKHAESMVGGLSAPSKMPSYAWSISAKRCNIGSTLAKVKSSVCYNCYALKGRYMFPMVQAALERRYHAWKDDRERWVDAMIYIMHNKKHIIDTAHFRWFDSGDIQGKDKNILKGYEHISTVYTKDTLKDSKGYICPSSKQGNKCGDCRACWNDRVNEVTYIAH
jgi:hypothetical protein